MKQDLSKSLIAPFGSEKQNRDAVDFLGLLVGPHGHCRADAVQYRHLHVHDHQAYQGLRLPLPDVTSQELVAVFAGYHPFGKPLLDKRGQRLTVELPAAIPTVEADPRRTVQVLVNLLSNASKYGPEHSAIAVEAVARDGSVRVSVADRGPGIPPEYRRRLFRRFVPPSPGSNDAQYGTGLGLSVVKAIVEAHGGRVGVDDRQGGGSIFWFTLPKAGEV